MSAGDAFLTRTNFHPHNLRRAPKHPTAPMRCSCDQGTCGCRVVAPLGETPALVKAWITEWVQSLCRGRSDARDTTVHRPVGRANEMHRWCRGPNHRCRGHGHWCRGHAHMTIRGVHGPATIGIVCFLCVRGHERRMK